MDKIDSGAGKTKMLPCSSPEVIVCARICRPEHFNATVLSNKGHVGCNWRDNFQFALHFQDDMRLVRPPA